MRKLYSLLFLSMVSLFAAQAAKADDACNTAANIVANCGFETGDFTDWTGKASTDPFSFALVDGSDPYSGDNAASFGPPKDEPLSQTLNTLTGTTYTISFAIAQMFGDPDSVYTNDMIVTFGSSTVLSLNRVAGGDYTFYTETATATGTSTDLTFTSQDGDGFWYLDSVSVTANAAPPPAIPEPSSLMLLGTGLAGGIGSALRRLRRKA